MPDSKDPENSSVGYVPDEEKDDEHRSQSRKPRRGAHATGDLRHRVAELEGQIKSHGEILAKVKAERDDFQDKYLRTLAEMDNFRKRVTREKEDFQRFVLSEFLLSLLEIYDNFERAIRSHSADETPQAVLAGVQMIFKQMQELLRRYQVKELNPHNKPFDPNFHQALAREERPDLDDPMVVEVYQKGFLYNDKLLRPALVRVAVPATGPVDENNGES